jgi:hypothetical protein
MGGDGEAATRVGKDAAARVGGGGMRRRGLGGDAVARVGRGGGADAVRCEEFFPRAGAARTGGMRGRCGNSPISMYLWDNFFWVS